MRDTRTNAEKLALFRRFFLGRTDVYGTYDPQSGRASQVKQPVTDAVLLAHLRGQKPYGVYLLVADRVRSAAVDFDSDDLAAPTGFVATAKGYRIPAHIERSKRKGYHVWVFMDQEGVLAAKIRAVMLHILGEMGMPRIEVFPKQDHLDDRTCYGNFINAPLFGRLVPEDRTVFLSPSDPTRPCGNQWDYLEQVQTVSEQLLDEIIEINDLGPSCRRPGKVSPASRSSGPFFALPPCARRMLTEGVTEFQRITCFRLAVHLKKAGVPRDLTVTTLEAWAAKNRPADGKRIITAEEIADQVKWAYEAGYRGCGCEEPAVSSYCSPDCPLQAGTRENKRASSPHESLATPVAAKPRVRS